MADRINVSGAATTLKYLDSDFSRINREITKMLDNLKYLQDNFYDLENYACTENYQNIAQSVYDSNGLIEIVKRVHKWCEKVDAFVEEEEQNIAHDKLEAEEARRELLNARRKQTRLK